MGLKLRKQNETFPNNPYPFCLVKRGTQNLQLFTKYRRQGIALKTTKSLRSLGELPMGNQDTKVNNCKFNNTIYNMKGLCAPGALVIGGQVHLFYQTYGNWREDAICHAVSNDGISFERNPSNPIFRPTGEWNCGRAIDAEVIRFKDRYLLYFATRDSSMTIQMQGVAAAPLNTNFNREDWTQLTDEPILSPKYPWEGQCVEGASIIQRGDGLYMFYAGAYNNAPQQVGVAKSADGIHWERLSNKPFLPNGDLGEWNSCESGHPHIFEDDDGRTYLFFQGNNDFGKTWMISKREVSWTAKGPKLVD